MPAQAFFTWQKSNKCHTKQRIYVIKKQRQNICICLLFCRLIDCEMFDQAFNSGSKMLDKLFATTSNFFEN
jgi:hypothetical protein